MLDVVNQSQIYSQDPDYGELDVALLEHLNITVLDDPDAQQIADEDTFVFAPFWGADCQIRAQCRHHQPNLYMGDTVSWDVLKLQALQTMEP